MAFFAGLSFFYIVFWLLSLTGLGIYEDMASRGAAAAGIMFIFVGISHFAKRDKIEAMIPESWPYRRAMNYVSGLAEIILGAGLFFPDLRYWAACGLILLLIAVYPANIHMAIKKPNFYNISRLFFQPAYMFWIWWFCMR